MRNPINTILFIWCNLSSRDKNLTSSIDECFLIDGIDCRWYGMCLRRKKEKMVLKNNSVLIVAKDPAFVYFLE